jgi:hypothetical protein
LPHPSKSLAPLATNPPAQSSTVSPKGTASPYRSARGRDTSDETNEEAFPETRPSARDRPRWRCPPGDRRARSVSCTTARGVRPRPKMKRPLA